MKLRVGHLYPDYLNIYADRGNIAVLARRAAWRGHEVDVHELSVGDQVEPGEHDLLYVGGGQDREQALVAEDLVAKAAGVRGAVAGHHDLREPREERFEVDVPDPRDVLAVGGRVVQRDDREPRSAPGNQRADRLVRARRVLDQEHE